MLQKQDQTPPTEPGRIHLITDTILQNRFSHSDLAEMAFRAGIRTVQFREKRTPLDVSELEKCIALAHQYNTQLIVNDWAEEAIRLGAQGAHVGQGDCSPEKIIQLAPKDFILGVTVHHEAEYRQIEHLPVDYIGIGPVFGTTSKNTGLPPLGLEGLKYLAGISRFPVIAIGSIDENNLASVMDTGVYGVAILSAFCCAENPESVAERLVNRFVNL